MTTAAFLLSWIYDKLAACGCQTAAVRQPATGVATAKPPLLALGDDVMFGKPEWFREKTVGWGLTPITWQGWAYALIWMAVIVAPFLGLLALRGGPEAALWLIGSLAFVVWDVRKILQQKRGNGSANQKEPEDDMLYITGDEEDASSLATRNYDMHVRR